VSERGRRLVHLSGAAVPLSYVVGLVPWPWIQYATALAVVVAAVLEFFRLTVGLDWVVYDRLTREYEQDNVAGYALYAVGLALAAWLFAPPVAAAAMLMLTIGDPISGALSQRSAVETKRWRTLAVMFGVCFALAVPLVARMATTGTAVAAAAVGALGATVADGVKPVVAGYVVDDNLTIPPAAAVGMTAVLAVLG
jgi:dolichol kinase